ncbi:MAG: hypothetical protein KF790_05570 [Steroidobacteraceae bacterium]|nr:hypothetical protein [Steroidobacteraceae bacterium]MCW5571619.1 hypothetical protein [Steroidobacteraceae bacterium]
MAEEFVSRAITHAQQCWCLDDAEIVREWCEYRTDADSPESFIDAIAADLGLIDSHDEAGAIRAARQLLDEYKDEFGDLREVLLAQLPA